MNTFMELTEDSQIPLIEMKTLDYCHIWLRILAHMALDSLSTDDIADAESEQIGWEVYVASEIAKVENLKSYEVAIERNHIFSLW